MRTILLRSILPYVALIMSVAAALAGTIGLVTSASTARAMELNTLATAEVNSSEQGLGPQLESNPGTVGRAQSTDSLSNVLASSVMAIRLNSLDQGGNATTRRYRGNEDGDHLHAPALGSEPAAALLFGAALVIGGGLLRRRHRTVQK
jgi:hypothetical protein